MKLFESNCTGFSPIPNSDNFHEQWVSGTYILTGIFPRSGDGITIAKIRNEVPTFYSLVKEKQKKKIPRGLSASYIIPVYRSSHFADDVLNWTKTRPKYKWAIWHEPVLFNDQTDEAIMNQNWGLYGLAYRDYLAQIICAYLSTISGDEIRLNGNQFKKIQPSMDPTR
jgi:hypothetical protein